MLGAVVDDNLVSQITKNKSWDVDQVCFSFPFPSLLRIEEEFNFFEVTSSGTGGFLAYLEPQYVHGTAPNHQTYYGQ